MHELGVELGAWSSGEGLLTLDTLVAAWHRTERCPLVHIPQRCNADPAQIPRAHGCDCGCAPLRGLATWSATFASCHLDAATCSWNPEIMFWCLEVNLPDSLHPSLATRAGAWQHTAQCGWGPKVPSLRSSRNGGASSSSRLCEALPQWVEGGEVVR